MRRFALGAILVGLTIGIAASEAAECFTVIATSASGKSFPCTVCVRVGGPFQSSASSRLSPKTASRFGPAPVLVSEDLGCSREARAATAAPRTVPLPGSPESAHTEGGASQRWTIRGDVVDPLRPWGVRPARGIAAAPDPQKR